VIEVEARAAPGAGPADLTSLTARLRRTCARVGIERATLGLLLVGPDEMARVNAEHRGTPEPTDVLAFPVDGPDVLAGWPADGPPPELGDILICPQAAQDPLDTLAVHGLLHLLGFDHEVDRGEMLALQDELIRG
jgi:probable rRNA maturation factor